MALILLIFVLFLAEIVNCNATTIANNTSTIIAISTPVPESTTPNFALEESSCNAFAAQNSADLCLETLTKTLAASIHRFMGRIFTLFCCCREGLNRCLAVSFESNNCTGHEESLKSAVIDIRSRAKSVLKTVSEEFCRTYEWQIDDNVCASIFQSFSQTIATIEELNEDDWRAIEADNDLKHPDGENGFEHFGDIDAVEFPEVVEILKDMNSFVQSTPGSENLTDFDLIVHLNSTDGDRRTFDVELIPSRNAIESKNDSRLGKQLDASSESVETSESQNLCSDSPESYDLDNSSDAEENDANDSRKLAENEISTVAPNVVQTTSSNFENEYTDSPENGTSSTTENSGWYTSTSHFLNGPRSRNADARDISLDDVTVKSSTEFEIVNHAGGTNRPISTTGQSIADQTVEEGTAATAQTTETIFGLGDVRFRDGPTGRNSTADLFEKLFREIIAGLKSEIRSTEAASESSTSFTTELYGPGIAQTDDGELQMNNGNTSTETSAELHGPNTSTVTPTTEVYLEFKPSERESRNLDLDESTSPDVSPSSSTNSPFGATLTVTESDQLETEATNSSVLRESRQFLNVSSNFSFPLFPLSNASPIATPANVSPMATLPTLFPLATLPSLAPLPVFNPSTNLNISTNFSPISNPPLPGVVSFNSTPVRVPSEDDSNESDLMKAINILTHSRAASRLSSQNHLYLFVILTLILIAR